MKELIKQHFNNRLDDAIIQHIAKLGTLKSFKKDDIIIDVNQELIFVPLVLKGIIKVLREDENENELLLYFLEKGDTCAMSLTCCQKKSKSKIRAVAESDVQLIMIPFEQMNAWFATNNSWRNFILESYQIRFNEMLETIDTLAFLKMDERLHKFLIDKLKVKGEKTLKITHQEIAENLNTSRVVISRLLKKLENEGLFKLYRNKIEVLSF
ncbi:Crp/Fnr family transcriptional regulator [Galbibacter mesophilus]|uniref:Crp/Fnr family transcriptional regulator n=1 Tax=Galbibacter mesophilus TaxID=379069 RepID=UPI0019201AF6|nr:Crp/Fnr family transcriptional regulator [Galbibacter mesophilus]MCM5662809.1 Crp/Fnr family transcriptional regulator [Galbibacter mesophilus]